MGIMLEDRNSLDSNPVSTIINVPYVKVAGWPIVSLSRKDFASLMVQDCFAQRKMVNQVLPKTAFSMNGQALSLSASSDTFSQAMRNCDYIQADGQSIVFSSKLLNNDCPLPERIATTDFFHDAAEVAVKHGLKFYILGASKEQNLDAVKSIKAMYPELQIVGSRDGYFAEIEEELICREIVDSGADVLWVGLGKPKEQLFVMRNLNRLTGIGWIKTCGGLFDFLAGKNKRAPKWMQSAGLEWLHRALSDPRRFLWRYLTTNVHSIYLILKGGR